MKNLGPASARMLQEVGVMNGESLREFGSVETYFRLKLVFGNKVNAAMLYALEAALRNCHWQAIEGEDKLKLRTRAGLE